MAQGAGDGRGVAFLHGIAGEGQRHFIAAIRRTRGARVTGGARFIGDLQGHRVAFDQVLKDLLACTLLGDPGDSNARSTATHIDVVRQVSGLRSADLARRDVDHLAVAQGDGQTTVLSQIGTGRPGQGNGVSHRLAFHGRVRRNAQLGPHGIDGIGHSEGRSCTGIEAAKAMVARIGDGDVLDFTVLEHIIALGSELTGRCDRFTGFERQSLAIAQGHREIPACRLAQGTGDAGQPPFLHIVAAQGQRGRNRLRLGRYFRY
ncbi:hypothetical protein D3C76_1055480 [compost metagenome]